MGWIRLFFHTGHAQDLGRDLAVQVVVFHQQEPLARVVRFCKVFQIIPGVFLFLAGGELPQGRRQAGAEQRSSRRTMLWISSSMDALSEAICIRCAVSAFAYDAVAISYYNNAVLKLLDSSAFQDNASNYVIYPDGRVVIDNSVNREKMIYNFIAMLRDDSDLSEEEILTLSDDFAQGRSGNRKVTLGDTRYYLVYEGTAVQSWTMLGLVPVNIVNASLDKLWFRTVQIVTGITVGLAAAIILLILRRNRTTLHRKNTEILYRDELFQKLSLNVDDVFLMLDAETSKVDLSGSAPPRSARSRAPALAWPSPKTSWI